MEESYFSLIMDKENLNSECAACRESGKIAAQQQ